jgi:hypothetical protein
MIFLLKGLDMIFIKCMKFSLWLCRLALKSYIMIIIMEILVLHPTHCIHSILYWLWMIWYHGVTIDLPTTTFVWNVTFFTLNIGYRIDENWNAERGFKCNFLESELSDWLVKNKHHVVLAALIQTYFLNNWYNF